MKDIDFSELSELLDSHVQRTEFLKAVNRLGLGRSDTELGTLLFTLQIYKGYYEKIPSELRAVHNAALQETRALRDEMKSMVDTAVHDAARVGQWAERIEQSMMAVRPEAVAREVQKRMTEEVAQSLSGSVQELQSAGARLEAATQKLNAASAIAEQSIGRCQTIKLRRVWARAFVTCAVLFTALFCSAWFHYFKLAMTWLYHEYNPSASHY